MHMISKRKERAMKETETGYIGCLPISEIIRTERDGFAVRLERLRRLPGEPIMTDESIIATSDDGRMRVRLVTDEDAPNPRTFYDHITHVITPTQSDWIDVDADGGPLQHGWDHFRTRADGEAMFVRWARIFHGAVVVEDRPVRGAWSFWYLMPAAFDEIGVPAEQYIKGDIAEYRAWADGEVYRYVVERGVDWIRRDDERESMTTWEEVDSCGRYYGWEFAGQAAKYALSTHLMGRKS
jgi:hypothetical protein